MKNSKKEIVLKVTMDIIRTLLLSVIAIVFAVMICVCSIIGVLIIIPACACVKTLNGDSLMESYASTAVEFWNKTERFINDLM